MKATFFMQRPITGLRYKSVAALLACGSMGMPFAVAAETAGEWGNMAKETMQQTQKVSGTVVDKDNVPIIGATVVVEGTSTGVITDLDGRYTIDMPAGKNKLCESAVGFLIQKLKINKCK